MSAVIEDTNPISEGIALRLGLASRALPDVEQEMLIKAVLDITKSAPTPLNLQALTVKKMREALNGSLSTQPAAQLKEAVAYLRGEKDVTEVADNVPEAVPYAEGDLPGSIRVAVASNTNESLDGHFGSCVRFLIYQVSVDEARLIDIRTASNERNVDKDKNDYRAQQIADCHLLYVVSIGGPAAAKVVRNTIHPIKKPNGGEAQCILTELRAALTVPPPWLAKVMGKDVDLSWAETSGSDAEAEAMELES